MSANTRDPRAICRRVTRLTVNMSVERVTWHKAPAIVGVLARHDARAVRGATIFSDTGREAT